MVKVMPLSSRCIKYLMFVFNLLFVITGIILLSIGLVIHGIYHDYEHFLDNKFFSVPSLLIAIGAIIFFIAFFGCCGAVRESYCMIITFTSLLVLVFVLELSGGISGYVLRSRASSIIKEKMTDTMSSYNSSKEIAFIWDKLQSDFDCCGTAGPSDWKEKWGTDYVPITCCEPMVGAIGTVNCTLASTDLHRDGCYEKFLSFIKSHAVQLGGIGIGVAFVQAIGIWFSIYLARSIRSSYESV